MKPRPLSRSITFWSGIFVMLFIGFAWRDSMTHTSFVSASKLQVMSGGALVQVWSIAERDWDKPIARRNPHHKWWPARPFGTPMLVRGDDFKQEEINKNDEIAVTYQDRMTGVAKWGFPRRNWVLFLPHWLVLLAFALAWAGLLLWRSRRRSRTAGVSHAVEDRGPVYRLDPAHRGAVITEVSGQGIDVSVQEGGIVFCSGNGAALKLVIDAARPDVLVTIYTTRQGDRGLTDAIESAILAHGGSVITREEKA